MERSQLSIGSWQKGLTEMGPEAKVALVDPRNNPFFCPQRR